MSDGISRSLGYVLCNWYVRYETPTGVRRLGLFVDRAGSLEGFDYTSPDPSRAHITSAHNMLFPTDRAALAALSKSLLGK